MLLWAARSRSVAGLEVERPARHQLLDRPPAGLLVVHLVAGDREEALADRVLLVVLEGVDRGLGEHRRPGGVEVRQDREPVHHPDPLLGVNAAGSRSSHGRSDGFHCWTLARS